MHMGSYNFFFKSQNNSPWSYNTVKNNLYSINTIYKKILHQNYNR